MVLSCVRRADDKRASNIRASIASDESGYPATLDQATPLPAASATPAKLLKGQKVCPQCKKICGNASRMCRTCNHIFISKSAAKAMSAAKRAASAAASQPSPVPLFRLSAEQQASMPEQPEELAVSGIFGHRFASRATDPGVDYLMQWAGGSYSGHTSWVKAKNAATCSELVAAYWSTGPNDLTHASISNQDQDCSDQDIRTMVPIGARLICLHED
jgi:hypothetical protein